MSLKTHKNKYLTLFLSLLILILGCVAPVDSYARKSKGKAKTTQTVSKRNKKSKGKKSKSSKKSKKKKGKRGNNSKSRKKRKRAYSSSIKTAPRVVETPQNDSLTLLINSAILGHVPASHNPGGLRVNSVKPDDRTKMAKVSLNESFTYLPITADYIKELKGIVTEALPDSLKNYTVALNVGRHSLAYYINNIDKLPQEKRVNEPYIRDAHSWSTFSKGMNQDNIALWHSHGRYFRQDANTWLWQRPVLFTTLEDIYTMGYVLPFLTPMLENAGANVLLPRERDTNRHEVIVDNDINDEGEIYSQPYYKEMSGSTPWVTGEGEGFIYDLPDFRDTENPFENGTYRQTKAMKSSKNSKPSVAAWYADIPQDGEYAVYVSYKTLPNSTKDARYTVNYSGGSKEFIVNQTMGGGTWNYLGTFPLKAGYSDKEAIVTLTNETDNLGDYVVTADAVKIGGGMGNIARSSKRSDIYYDPSTPEDNSQIDEEDEDSEDDEEDEDEGDDVTEGEATDEEQPAPANVEKPKTGKAPVFKTSGLPRYLEGARYWLQWAGMPEYIYSPFHGANDYKDDYTSRGHWVNYLAGGSRVLPGEEGLNIPIDLSMALHSDAGKRSDDSFVGTLGIYYTNDGASYADGTPRINSRMFTDLLMRQITHDIRQEFEPRWTRRSMWDKSYLEARVAEVPTSLIELMSHQNYADMMYGLDPVFRFVVSRAIYKGMARFLSERKDRELVIQPLPVKDFYIKSEKGKGEYLLGWEPREDKMEPTAMPDKYIILERTEGKLGFHKIGETSARHFKVKVTDDNIHSFKVVAVNEGGVSFDSEILALRNSREGKPHVLIVNGFTRVSGPGRINQGDKTGFDTENDFGVPYIKDISFSGPQYNFSRSSGNSFGSSSSSYIDKVIAGNTFDFVAEHGRSIEAAGYGFVSSSASAVEKGDVKLDDFKVVDLILGKQKTTTIGNGKSGIMFEAFPSELQKRIKNYLHRGGHIFVSGQYVASDAYTKEQEFVEDVLGVVPVTSDTRPSTPRAVPTQEAIHKGMGNRNYTYNNTLNDEIYIVEKPDGLSVSGSVEAVPLMTFSDNNTAVAMYTNTGKGSAVLMSIPFETIRGDQQRDALMKDILNIFE